MAFESLPGVKAVSYGTGQTFLVGDFFSVYEKGSETPAIYRWPEVTSITENRTDFIVCAGEAVYRIPKSCLLDDKIVLNLRGVFEGAISVNPDIEYNHQKRILPPKYLYLSGDMSDAPYVANGTYKEREINLSNVILLNTRLARVFKVILFIAIIAMFIFLHFSHGDTRNNWFYYLPISIFTGGICVMFVYLVCTVIANYHYTHLFKTDPAVSEEITFTVSADGFAAVESHLNTGYEFIPWYEANYFIETNSVFIVYKHNKAVFWLPKRLFTKEVQNEMSDFISTKLLQK
ncbi:MAG: YcxB family protein [Oscillospiraceae bacterium]|nr:YcxB family protein [Oscillospiraceae bacterium]